MYSRFFWDNLYRRHIADVPWMKESWQGDVLNAIDPFIPSEAKSLLDYGCGNGFMGHYYYQKGFSVDLADISDYLVDKLRIKYVDTNIHVIRTDTPDELFEKTGQKYDVVLAWSLFHHINPIDWSAFLYGFSRLLNFKGVLVVGGWDISDVIIKKDGGKARYTGKKTWPLNALIDYVEDDFHVLHNDVLEVSAPSFAIKRIIRYYILEKNN